LGVGLVFWFGLLEVGFVVEASALGFVWFALFLVVDLGFLVR
jgi:hypothetical protein